MSDLLKWAGDTVFAGALERPGLLTTAALSHSPKKFRVVARANEDDVAVRAKLIVEEEVCPDVALATVTPLFACKARCLRASGSEPPLAMGTRRRLFAQLPIEERSERGQ